MLVVPYLGLMELVNPYTKTVSFVRVTAWGERPAAPPKGYKPRPGWRIVRHKKANHYKQMRVVNEKGMA